MKIYQLIALAAATFSTALAADYEAEKSCTKTIKPTSFTCCGTIAAHTTTSYTNCHGCALEYEPTPQCRCISNPVTDSKLTSTETACAATFTTSATKCLTTATYTANGCGDCGHTYATTKTSRVDCKGCALVTTTTTGLGICMCPTATETTVKACKASPKPTGY